MASLTELIEQLRAVIHDRRDDYVKTAESIIAEIAKIEDASVVGALISCFDDTSPHDELMFSIVHTIERWDDETYSREVSNTVESFWRHSPRWAQIVHLRILNSEVTLQAYLECLESSGASKRSVACEIFGAIARRWPKLASKAEPLVERLKSGQK
jgi:hypothetical protein